MLPITPSFAIDDSELHLDYIRAAGPGGQNVNKVSTAVQLRYDVRSAPSLPAEVKERLLSLAGSRATEEGVLIIEARRHRTQEQNRLDALQRLADLVRQALQPPKPRHATRPSLSSKTARLEHKKQHGRLKQLRRSDPREERN